MPTQVVQLGIDADPAIASSTSETTDSWLQFVGFRGLGFRVVSNLLQGNPQAQPKRGGKVLSLHGMLPFVVLA